MPADKSHAEATKALTLAPPEIVATHVGHLIFHDPATGQHHEELTLEMVLAHDTAIRFSNGQRAKRWYCKDWDHLHAIRTAAFIHVFKERKRIQALEDALSKQPSTPIEKGEFNDDYGPTRRKQHRHLGSSQHHRSEAR